jgi:hypothetical protein
VILKSLWPTCPLWSPRSASAKRGARSLGTLPTRGGLPGPSEVGSSLVNSKWTAGKCAHAVTTKPTARVQSPQ